MQADGAALPFTAEVFDVVVANFVFEHFAHPDRALKETQRVLKNGGLLYLSIRIPKASRTGFFAGLGAPGITFMPIPFIP